MGRWVTRVARVEAPTHRKEIVARIRHIWGVGRAGHRIQDAVNDGIKYAIQQGEITVDRNVVMHPGREIKARDRSQVQSASLRKVEMLPPQEIQAGVRQIVEASHTIGLDELATGVARLLGYKSTSRQLKEVIDGEIRKMTVDLKMSDEVES